jgi:hypothetical protein
MSTDDVVLVTLNRIHAACCITCAHEVTHESITCAHEVTHELVCPSVHHEKSADPEIVYEIVSHIHIFEIVHIGNSRACCNLMG